MKPKKVWAVYFSPTGTAKKTAAFIAKRISVLLGADYAEHDFTLPKARESGVKFREDEMIVFGVPVYAGRVPSLMLKYIKESIKGRRTLCVPVVMFGGRDFGDALAELGNIAAENGFLPIAAGAFVGEHSFSDTLCAGRPDDEDMSLADELARAAAGKAALPEAELKKAVSVPGCDPVRPYYIPRGKDSRPIADFIRIKPKTDMSKCTECGLCAKVCPLGSIDARNVSEVFGKCMKCCACVKKCPSGAKYFDHEGFLYHKSELETVYGARRAHSRIFE